MTSAEDVPFFLTMSYGEVVAGVAIVYPSPGGIFVAIQIFMFRLKLIGKPQISTTNSFQLQPGNSAQAWNMVMFYA